MDSEQAKCLAFNDAVSWCKELHLTHMVFETDLKGIEGYINNSSPVIAWENEVILLDVIGRLKTIPQWGCNFVPRFCNNSVDKLAKFSKRFGITNV